MIALQHVHKHYGSVEAVRDVSFEVGTAEIVGLLGPNGAGKTTIMRIVTCYHFPNTGSVTVNGYDAYVDPLRIKANIGYLPENAPLYGDMSVYEYLKFMAQARGVGTTQIKERIDWAIGQCGLEAVAYRTIDDISKGYRQRTGLAQAIIHDPPILILDEPTTGLDPNQIIEIRAMIRALGTHKTVILSTHILQEVEAICDRVLILNNGEIAAMGATNEIASGMRGGDIYVMECKRSVADDIAPLLSKLPHLEQIISVERIPLSDNAQSGDTLWQVEISIEGDVAVPGGELLFDWAVAHDIKILELSKKRFSLEDVFTKLTTVSKEEQTA